MDETPDLLIEKLAAPVEDLGLERRVYHALKREKILTIADLINRDLTGGWPLRNIGPVATTHIFSRTADFLGIPADRVMSDEMRRMATQVRAQGFAPLDAPVTILSLPLDLLTCLREARTSTIRDLVALSNNQYQALAPVPRGRLREIDEELLFYLTSHQVPLEGTSESAAIGHSDSCDPLLHVQPSEAVVENTIERQPNLGVLFGQLRVNERGWRIIELRGLRYQTLQEIAAEIGGPTRERVRQILSKLESKIRMELGSFSTYFDFFETATKSMRRNLPDHQLHVQALIAELIKHLEGSGLSATEKELETLIAMVRMLVLQGQPETIRTLEAAWKGMLFVCGLVEPPITKYERVGNYINKKVLKQKQLNHKELAHRVLSESKQPLHWSEICDRAYKLHRRKDFDTRALYNALLRHRDVFVRVGQGTYALKEWGSPQAEPYTDIVASVLKEENRALSFQPLLAKVLAVRLIGQGSLRMCLDMHPRFYRSIADTYGLRGWLPARHMQNLRTPEWLIEDTKSFERVARAQKRGYDVESLIANDTLRVEQAGYS